MFDTIIANSDSNNNKKFKIQEKYFPKYDKDH